MSIQPLEERMQVGRAIQTSRFTLSGIVRSLVYNPINPRNNFSGRSIFPQSVNFLPKTFGIKKSYGILAGDSEFYILATGCTPKTYSRPVLWVDRYSCRQTVGTRDYKAFIHPPRRTTSAVTVRAEKLGVYIKRCIVAAELVVVS